MDQSGSPLKGIRVLASSATQIGGAKTAYTNEEGAFRFLALQPGSFEVRASAPRLKTVVLKDVRVGISAPAEVNLVMEVETAAEEVQVVERAPLISTTSANVKEVFDLDMVESLPHGSRDDIHTQVINDVAGGINGRIRGGAANQTIYTQDGFDIRGQVPTLKASAAYEINTGGYGVDNPMASGGSINMVTKSGSNKFEFELNATADSNRMRFFTDATDAAAPTYLYFINPLISGPIIKDKLWFHFNTEVYFQQNGRDPDVEGYLPDPATYRKWVPKGTLKVSWQVSPRNKLQSLTNFDFPNELNRRGDLGVDPLAQESRRGQRVFQGLIWESLLKDDLIFRSQIGFTTVPMHIYPARCEDEPVACDHTPAVIQRFPKRQDLQNNSNHQRDDRYSLQFQNRLDWMLSSRRFGEHALQLKNNFYSEQDIRRVSRPGDAVIELNGIHPRRQDDLLLQRSPAGAGALRLERHQHHHRPALRHPERLLAPQPLPHADPGPLARLGHRIQQRGRPPGRPEHLRAGGGPWPGTPPTTGARWSAPATTTTSTSTSGRCPATRWAGMTQLRCRWNEATQAFDSRANTAAAPAATPSGWPVAPPVSTPRGSPAGRS